MRGRLMLRWLAVVALVSLLSVAAVVGEEAGGSGGVSDPGPADAKAVATASDNDSKKTRSFVAATLGSAHALTLTTFLTDAAHLHYAVLPAGLPALDAEGIKTAAEQCRADVSEAGGDVAGRDAAARRRLPGTNNAVERFKSASAAAAETVTVSKAQKVVSTVENLLPNTSYDVYFVAEVIGSNGVFGPVQSVLQSWTHPEPPAIGISFVGPANASSDTVLINATLTTPGRAYFALVPSGSDDANVLPSPEDLVMNRTSGAGTPGSHYMLHSILLGTNDSYAFQEVMGKLTPATLYNMFVMTEAPGNGQVRSEVTRHSSPVRTHALAPEVASLKCSPVNASASALDVRFKLDVDQKDIDRANLDTLSFFKYDLHYEVIALSDNAASKKQTTITSSNDAVSVGAGATRSTDDISALKNTTIRGVFSMENYSSIEDFFAGLKATHHANITGLQSGTLYKVKLRAETAGSNGLFGLRELTAQAKTHEEAPTIAAAVVQATNRSVNSLTLTVDLARSRGNLHYVLTGKRGSSANLRSVFQQATSVENLQHLLRERSSRDFDENDVITGIFKFSSDEIISIKTSNPNPNPRSRPIAGTPSGKIPEESITEAFRQEFEITGLADATSYTIALLPETTKSFGLFGRAFSPLLEATTNENASDVELRSVKPHYGNTSAIELEVSMTKPQDALFLCLLRITFDSEATGDADDTEVMSSDSCQEVENRENVEHSRGPSNLFTFTVGNLSEDTDYRVSLYAENVRRNGVLSDRTEELTVRTHKSAPHVVESSARPTAATTSKIEAQVTLEPGSTCILHYVVREAQAATDTEEVKPVDAATIVEYSSESSRGNRAQFQRRLPPASFSSFVSGGNVFAGPSAPDTTTDFAVQELTANTTYELFVVAETSRDGNSSGVFGEPVVFNVTTHAFAPKIVLATVDPVPGSTDSVIISANLSHPGILHYFLSDVDFADPAIISHSDAKHAPHELRGQLQVLEEHILMEVINGTNDTRPTDPLTFVHNTTVGGLESGRTYHVSLTTETYGSDGVFGEFPPPVLVNTHLGPPVIIPETLSLRAVAGSSSALAIDFQLDRFGDVHYALFFRGLVPDRSRQLEEDQKAESKPSTATEDTKDGDNETIAIWPPLVSTFDLTLLNGSMLKAAELEELGVGVWANDTISVSREDVTRGKLAHKEIDKLPANALFDICLVSETAASGGILGWPSDGNASACHRVATHADYTNQSKLFDEISVHGVSGRTDGVRIDLNVSKLLNAPDSTDTNDGTIMDRFARAAGRVPYFVLLDATSRSGRDSGAFSSHRGEVTNAFKEASPGRGDGVVAAGMLANISAENATALRIEQDVFGLDANHEYLLFFAYETSDSDGVFTRVNPHKLRSNDSRFENDGIRVTTYEAAPRVLKAKAQPSFGHTTQITVKFDIACDSCESAIVHLLVFPDDCKSPRSVGDTLRLDQLSSSESNTSVNTSPYSEQDGEHCKIPLAQKRVKLEMPERQHSRNGLEEDLGGEHVLTPNTSYIVLMATETVGSHGVLSEKFEEPLRVRTHAPAPSFTEIRLEPRTGSTTELLLAFALDRPGEVHYMLGVSDNAEFNVTSPHNISSKGIPNGDRHGRSRGSHDYRQDVVRTRRSVTYSDGEHVELLDYLLPGTSYSLFIVSEALPADHGIYGSIQEVNDVSTFANAPILLAHTAYPTPGTTKSLTVGFRMDAPGIVYFSVVAVKPWDLTYHVAEGSDRYGNRLALQDELVAQKNLDVDQESMELESDSGWREQILEVPQTGMNYTVHLVTETKGSGGIYGTVATHAGVRAHSEAPELVNVSVNPTDARVDALSVNVTLSGCGHVHYIALPSGRGSAPPSDDFLHHSTELSALASGSVDVNESAGSIQETSFRITGLTEGTSYDLYFRAETFESFGVFGAWTRQAVTTRTHGLPPDVLPEAVECKVIPSCDERGRETCSRKANVCGKCLSGYTTTSNEEILETNEPCVKLEPAEDKRSPTIKINGVMRNPNLHMSEMEPKHGEGLEQELPLVAPEGELPAPEQHTLEYEVQQEDAIKQIVEDGELTEQGQTQGQPVEPFIVQDTVGEELSEPVVLDQPMQVMPVEQLEPEHLLQQQPHVEQEAPAIPDQGVDAAEYEPIQDPQEPAGCPLNAQATTSGLCECIPGYEVDEGGTSCVLSRMATAAEAAATTTSAAFDILNAHHQIPGHSV